MKIKPPNPIAKDLRQPKYKQRIVENKKKKKDKEIDWQDAFDNMIKEKMKGLE